MKIVFLLSFWVFSAPLFAQIYSQENIIVQDEALLFVQGGGLHFATGSTLQNRGTLKLAGNWQNNASPNLLFGKGKIIFSDPERQFIRGNFPTNFAFLEIQSHSVRAEQTISIFQNLHFTKGNLFFQKMGFLGENASISGEKDESYATGTLQTTRRISGNSENFGNMGLSLDPAGQDLGQTTLVRKAGEGTAVEVPFQSSINRTWEIRTEKPVNQPVTLKLQWLAADNNSRDLLKAQVWESTDGLVWTGIKPAQNLTSLETSLKTKNLHHFTISGTDLKGVLLYSNTVFEESGLNNGSIGNTLSITLVGNYEFNAKIGEDLAAGKKVEVSNVPAGLTLQVWYMGNHRIELKLVGKALDHQIVNSIKNMGLKFLPSAFLGGNPFHIGNSDYQTIGVVYREESLPEEVLIYPNPATDIANIQVTLAAPGRVKISLYDNYQLIYEAEQNAPDLVYKAQIDVSYLIQNVYILKIETQQNVFVKKVVKE